MTIFKYSMLNNFKYNCYIWAIQLTVFILAQWSIVAEAEELNNLQIHGFLSQGYIKTTDKKDVFGNSSEDGSFRFRELGLNASLRPLTNLQLSAQILSRSAGEGNSGGIRVDYGFVDYSMVSDVAKQAGFRLGRTKNPFGFYNETRDVPFTRPSILLPQSIYFDRTRNLGLASDGIQLYGESRNEFGDIFVQLGAGFPIVNGEETIATLLDSAPGKLNTKPSFIGRVMYERDGGRFRLGVSGAHVNIGYDPDLSDKLRSGSVQFTPIVFSAQYNAEHWSLTSEYALRHFKYNNFNEPFWDNMDFFGESFYFQGIYRLSSRWEGVLRYDVLFTDRSDRDGSDFSAKTGARKHTRYAKDITVGLRFNITPELMFRAEYHHVKGTAWLSSLDNPDPFDTAKHWNLFAAQLSYRF